MRLRLAVLASAFSFGIVMGWFFPIYIWLPVNLIVGYFIGVELVNYEKGKN